MKKIETGCKVMIVSCFENPSMIGSVFIVGPYAGIKPDNSYSHYGPAWFLNDAGIRPWAEECLMRIDDDATIEEKETNREKSWSQ